MTQNQLHQKNNMPMIAFNSKIVGYVEPKREWIELNMDELADICVRNAGYPLNLANEIQMKLKQKNL